MTFYWRIRRFCLFSACKPGALQTGALALGHGILFTHQPPCKGKVILPLQGGCLMGNICYPRQKPWAIMLRPYRPKIGNTKADTPLPCCGSYFDTISHSHSTVAGGFVVTSNTTRLTPFTSLVIRRATVSISSYGSRAEPAVTKSRVVTARNAIVSS